MPITQVPAIDQNVCSGWSEQAVDIYNALPFYFAKHQVERRKTYTRWAKFTKKRAWKPNMGDTLRLVRTEPSPHKRQTAYPTAIAGGLPKKDVIDIREVTTDAVVNRHRFESLNLNFLPDFRDFLTHVNDHSRDVMEKMERYEDVFIRTGIFDLSPFVWIPDRAGDKLVSAPHSLSNQARDAANSKTTTWLQAMLPEIGQPGNLSLLTLNSLLTTMEVDLRAVAFKGSALPKEDQPLAEKFALVCSSEAFNQFIFDPFLLNNKNCALDVVQETFKGNLFGRITCMLEDLPIRIKADGTLPEVETREGNPDAYNYGETVIHPDYRDAPYEVAFMIGGAAYEQITVGPPPAAFAGSGMPQGFGKMFWNGEVNITKNLLVQCVDENGDVQYDMNKYGEWLQVIAQAVYGLIRVQPRFVVPIIFRRKRGASQP